MGTFKKKLPKKLKINQQIKNKRERERERERKCFLEYKQSMARGILRCNME